MFRLLGTHCLQVRSAMRISSRLTTGPASLRRAFCLSSRPGIACVYNVVVYLSPEKESGVVHLNTPQVKIAGTFSRAEVALAYAAEHSHADGLLSESILEKDEEDEDRVIMPCKKVLLDQKCGMQLDLETDEVDYTCFHADQATGEALLEAYIEDFEAYSARPHPYSDMGYDAKSYRIAVVETPLDNLSEGTFMMHSLVSDRPGF